MIQRAVFPLNTVLFPGGPLPLRIFEPRYVDMVSRCMRAEEPFVVTAIIDGSETGEASFHDVGTLAHIVDFQAMPDGLLGILVRGGERVRLHEVSGLADGLRVARIETLLHEARAAVGEQDNDLVELLQKLLAQIPENFYPEDERDLSDASWVSYRLTELLPLANPQKQYFLEMEDATRRLEVIRPLLESMQGVVETQ